MLILIGVGLIVFLIGIWYPLLATYNDSSEEIKNMKEKSVGKIINLVLTNLFKNLYSGILGILFLLFFIGLYFYNTN